MDAPLARRQRRATADVAAGETSPAARNALITGATDGIGYALAQCTAADDYTITGLDIDETRAQAAQQTLQAVGCATWAAGLRHRCSNRSCGVRSLTNSSSRKGTRLGRA